MLNHKARTMNSDTFDKIKLIVVSVLLVSVIAILTIFVSQRGGSNMKEMPENAAIKSIVKEQIARDLNQHSIVAMRLIPEQSQTGYYLSGEFAGSVRGSFAYSIELDNQDTRVLSVKWHKPKNTPSKYVVIEGYKWTD